MEIYMDNAATTRVSSAALNAMVPCFQELYGNPSSVHTEGRASAAVLGQARASIAACLGAVPKEIYFTSGGTEADNWAIRSAAIAGEKKGKKHIVSSAFEHHAVLHTLQALEKEGFEVTLLPVHRDGVVRPEELELSIREDTALVTIMFANNEIGTVQPIAELGAICRENGVLFHTDAVQAVGHLAVDVKAQNIDMLSLSAHKFHGPKGIGALYCKKDVSLTTFIEGGVQERGRRGGTENIPGIIGMAAALQEATDHLDENFKKIVTMRDALAKGLAQIPCSRNNSGSAHQLPGILNFCFDDVEGETLLMMLDMAGIRASSGSACTSGSLDASHILLSLGLSHEVAHSALRLSLCESNTMAEVEYVLDTLPYIVACLRNDGTSALLEGGTDGQ